MYKPLTTVLLLATVFFSCAPKQEKTHSADPKIDKLKLPDDFTAEHLYSPGDNGQGSWVAMTFDPKGRLIVSDQFGYLYRVQLPAIGDSSKLRTEPLYIGGDTSSRVTMGYAQGLLWAFNSLYVMVNHNSDEHFEKSSGLYRLQDTDGDDQFDKVTLLKELKGEGEHGPHSIVLSPDGHSLYVIAGNFTRIPEMNRYRSAPTDSIDNLLPIIKDPGGHDKIVNAHGGWIAKVDSTGTDWELISSGYRNAFDMAFNEAGELFTYDSDMEWDFGMPWYRPTRICHVTSGSEFGWRPGTAKWDPAYPDNLPGILNIGQGSPTNVVSGKNARFPEKYRKAIFAFDWSFGIIYAVHLEPDGGTYKAKAEEFLSGSALPLTDGVIGPDGAMYFLTGGRRLESDLYRIYYKNNTPNKTDLDAPVLTDAQKTRRALEAYHGKINTTALDAAWPHLRGEDRYVRFAARICVEGQPIETWQQRALAETDPVTVITLGIALARKGTADAKDRLLHRLTGLNFSKLNDAQQIDALRAIELAITRLGMPDSAQKVMLNAYLSPLYPAKTNALNRELSKLLVYLDAPEAVSKTMTLLASAKDDPEERKTATASEDLIMRNPRYGLDIAAMLAKIPPMQQTWYATVLSTAASGWTEQDREKYFKWFYNAFSYKGGRSFVGFIDYARKSALALVPKDEFSKFNSLSGDSLVSKGRVNLTQYQQPKGPGRRWKLEEAVRVIDSGLSHRDFERGKAIFNVVLCSSCHSMAGEGGTSGPDLTQLGTRFSTKDMLESIIDPNKTVSDQYGAMVFTLKDGTSVLGRLVNEDDDNYYISQNPFAPQTLRELEKDKVLSTKASKVSVMLPGLINSLSPEELKDLVAYLKGGGNPKDTIFAPMLVF
ncbi:c-type cytochrome [Chitinophaga barathri]|uniref:Heme-binding protein n=1 Tax=Chitinophaga barathri TaxID=1647451 RepID=A0A3N4N1F5_9BACT|nr:c-type cytochrome [Chitinophaga barathri]RPD41443.1 heme-binding protein [Chitinophaga barathri]